MMLIDGKEGEWLPASDRGLLYGDGLFETIAIRAGIPQLWSQHMQRLQVGCARLGIAAPDAALLRREAEQVIATAQQAVLKIIITRGSGGRGYRAPQPSHPRRILSLYPWPDYPQDYAQLGIEARLCTTPLAINPRLAGIKHLNRLEQVLARSEWDDSAIAEGIMLDTEGNVVEGTMSNLFLVHQGRLQTPSVERCGVAGIMRAEVMQAAAQLNIPCDVTRLSLDALEQADEVLFTNSLIGIWPLRKFGSRQWSSWPIRQSLMQAMSVWRDPAHA